MQGQNNSVLTRLREAIPDLFVLKCFCHSFHFVASYACEVLSKTAEQLVQDIYNYFKISPNKQKSYEEFQQFVDCEPHKILKPWQTRWLSLSQWRIQTFATSANANVRFLIDKIYHAKFCETMRK